MSRKRIFIDATGIVEYPTGLGNYCEFLLASLLGDDRYDYTVLHQSALPPSHPLLSAGLAHIEFLTADMPVIGPRRERTMYGLRQAINRSDLFHCLSSYLPAFGLDIPSVVTVHDLKYLFFPSFFGNRMKTLYYGWIVRRGIGQAKRIISISEATKRDLEKLGVPAGKIDVIYEAPTIDTDERGTGVPVQLGGKPYFLFVGVNRPHKNVANLITAFEVLTGRLKDRGPLLVLAGGGFDPLRRRFGSNERLVFLGPVGGKALPILYRGSIALVYPSLYEGFGLPILEAMALGTPVITSNCSAMPEVAGDAALLVDPRDPRSIAEAMITLVENEPEREHLASLGLRRAAGFSWDLTARRTLELYDRILAGG